MGSRLVVNEIVSTNNIVINAVSNVEIRTPTSGTHTNVDLGLAKVWSDFDGTSTITESDGFNSSSLTDNGTGTYAVNMSNAFSTANYGSFGAVSNGDDTSSSNRSAMSWHSSSSALGLNTIICSTGAVVDASVCGSSGMGTLA
jgi:hypothetical protein